MESIPKILIIEDTPAWQESISNILLTEGYDTFIAEDILSAIGIIEKHIIDLAIVDIRLEDGDVKNTDGLKFLDYLEKYYLDDHTHAIMLSAHAKKEDVIYSLTHPSGNVLNFFLKEKLDIDDFVSEVQRSIRATLQDRKKVNYRILANMFTTKMESIIDVQRFISDNIAENKYITNEINNLLVNILIKYNPLSNNLVITYDEETSKLKLLCWSRKDQKVIGALIKKKSVQHEKIIPENPWSNSIVDESVISSSTDNLAGISFEVVDITFESLRAIKTDKQ